MMGRHTLTVLMFLLFVAAQCLAGRGNQSNGTGSHGVEHFVSLDCKDGDITLTLEPDHRFVLDIQYWDAQNYMHMRADTLKGSWKISGKELELKASKGLVLLYELKTSSMQIGSRKLNPRGYGFKSGTSKCFATGYELLDESEVDPFFLESIQELDSTKK